MTECVKMSVTLRVEEESGNMEICAPPDPVSPPPHYLGLPPQRVLTLCNFQMCAWHDANNHGVKVNYLGSNSDCDNCQKTLESSHCSQWSLMRNQWLLITCSPQQFRSHQSLMEIRGGECVALRPILMSAQKSGDNISFLCGFWPPEHLLLIINRVHLIVQMFIPLVILKGK